jgi:hypothetical protein
MSSTSAAQDDREACRGHPARKPAAPFRSTDDQHGGASSSATVPIKRKMMNQTLSARRIAISRREAQLVATEQRPAPASIAERLKNKSTSQDQLNTLFTDKNPHAWLYS